jgi:hypothetical protein
VDLNDKTLPEKRFLQLRSTDMAALRWVQCLFISGLLESAHGSHYPPTLKYSATISGVPSFGTGGVSVSADGQTIIVGAPNASNGDGSIFVASMIDDAWTEPSALPAQCSLGSLGASVGLTPDGRSVVAGAPGTNGQAGSVLIFGLSRDGWEQVDTLTASDTGTTTVANLGAALAWSADGAILIAGAPASIVNGQSRSGAAVVFVAWPPPYGRLTQASILSFGSAEQGDAGFSAVAASLSGLLVAGGAPAASSSSGAASAFMFNETSWRHSHRNPDRLHTVEWIEAPLLPPSPLPPGSAYGSSIAVSEDGEMIMVGAPGAPGGGAVFVFSLSQPRSTNTLRGSATHNAQLSSSLFKWDYVTILTAPAGSGAAFGSSLSLSYDGNTAFVGSVAAVGGGGSIVDGSVYQYLRTDPRNASSWIPVPGSTPWLPPSPTAGEGFGHTLACNGLTSDSSATCIVGTSQQSACGTSNIYIWSTADN